MDAIFTHRGEKLTMCGIAGVLCARGQKCDEAILQRLASALAHRGPDGTRISVNGNVGLVHTRLSIVDLERGSQPISFGGGTMVANGEIYNDLQLRQELSNEKFVTGSDCEPALHLWLRNRRGFAAKLRGMYALGMVDDSNQHTDAVLSRDPFGIKPLYFVEFENSLVFASEAGALLDAGVVPREIRQQSLDELLAMQFTTGRDTIFQDVKRVLPGETIDVCNGRTLSKHRASPLPVGGVEDISERDALSRLDTALENSVSAHERADVPFGMFLSGGIDSAAVLAIMARLGRKLDTRSGFSAWTARFDTPQAADESAKARRMAEVAGVRHSTLTITRDMVWKHLPEIVSCMDDPVADYAIIPTWFLAREARSEATVILSGEGGDELFAGYGRYRHAMKPWWRGGRPMRRRSNFDRLGVLRDGHNRWRDGISLAEIRFSRDSNSRLSRAQSVDIEEWLPNDLLLKLDRCLMAHGVEGRTPLLDPVVAEAVWRLPDNMKVRDGKGKWLLRRWLADVMPEAEPFAPKQGFTVPVGEWIASDGARLGQLVARQPIICEIAMPDRVESLFRNPSSGRARHAAWTLLFLALWHKRHLQGLSLEGDVFDALSVV